MFPQQSNYFEKSTDWNGTAKAQRTQRCVKTFFVNLGGLCAFAVELKAEG
jgi:hypothetical protein